MTVYGNCDSAGKTYSLDVTALKSVEVGQFFSMKRALSIDEKGNQIRL